MYRKSNGMTQDRYEALGEEPRIEELAVTHSCDKGLEGPFEDPPEKSPERPPKSEDEGEEAGIPTNVRNAGSKLARIDGSEVAKYRRRMFLKYELR